MRETAVRKDGSEDDVHWVTIPHDVLDIRRLAAMRYVFNEREAA
jgi:hypothetical protein